MNQLVSLSIHRSINAQIPYLLRFILPKGLPNLRSLEIDQMPSSEKFIRDLEGAMWHETSDGEFRTEKGRLKAWKGMHEDYMPSIAKATPNIEELGLKGRTWAPGEIIVGILFYLTK